MTNKDMNFGPESQENKLEAILEQLIEGKRDVRISMGNESHLGKMFDKDRNGIYLKPYVVYESLYRGEKDNLQRARLEKEHIKPIPRINIIPEVLSEGYIEQLIKSHNYMNSLELAKKTLRKELFNPQIYLMPSKEEIELLESEGELRRRVSRRNNTKEELKANERENKEKFEELGRASLDYLKANVFQRIFMRNPIK